MARKNSSNMGEFTFKTRLSSEQIEQLWELTKQDPTRRSIIARMDDGSYRLLGEIVKLPDCPQEEFDKALERLTELANGYDKEQPTPSATETEMASSLRDETGRLYEHIDTPITRYSEEHFDYDSFWDSLTPKGGRPFGPADLEAAILFGYNLNPKHK